MRRNVAFLFLTATMVASLLSDAGGAIASRVDPLAQVAPAKTITAARAKVIRRFWTEARMKRAVPVPVDSGAAGGTPAPISDGAPVSIAGRAPRSGVAPAELLQPQGSGGTRTEYYWPGPFNTHPASTAGRIFFSMPSDPAGVFYTCTGTSVQAENRSLVVTAGHCLADPGQYASRWVFCPGYRDGNCRFGRWPFRTLRTTVGFYERGNPAYDIGTAIVKRNGDGVRLGNYVGTQGIAWRQLADQYWYAFGYPGQAPFTGERLYVCEDRSAGYYDPSPTLPGPTMILIDCSMTPGSSGGGWLILPNRNWIGYVNTVTSIGRRTGGVVTNLAGPYFGDAAANLYNASRY